MSWGGYGHIRPGDILVLKEGMKDDNELTRHIVVSSRCKAAYGGEVVHTLYTIYNSRQGEVSHLNVRHKVGTTFTLTRKQMINNYTAVWSKLC